MEYVDLIRMMPLAYWRLGLVQLDLASGTHPSLSILPSRLSNPKVEEEA
jgi:hypothetical protein